MRISNIDTNSQNRYAYCANDPVNFIDPSGHATSSSSSSSSSSKSSSSSSSSSANTISQSGSRTINGVKETGSWVTDTKTGKTTFSADAPKTTVSVKDDPNSTQRTIIYTTSSSSGKTVVTITIPDRYNPNKNPIAMKVTSTQNGKTTSYTYEDVRGLISVPSAPKVDAKTEVAVAGFFKDPFVIGQLIESNETVYYAVRAIADIVQIAYGVYGFISGLKIIAKGLEELGGGIMLCLSGAGFAPGVAISTAGLALVGVGVAVSATGALIVFDAANNFSDNVGKALNNNSGGDKSSSLTDKEGKIANETGHSTKEIKNAIEKVKQEGGWRSGGNNRNPDVMVDTKTGEVYPKTPNGGIGDSIGNIFDYLP